MCPGVVAKVHQELEVPEEPDNPWEMDPEAL